VNIGESTHARWVCLLSLSFVALLKSS
jgi:hypothetical protein